MTVLTIQPSSYPVQFMVDYPDRGLKRLTTALPIVVAIPILVMLESVSGWHILAPGVDVVTYGAGAALFLGPQLMIVFRRKDPRWWFDWNLELRRFGNRVLFFLWIAAVVAVVAARSAIVFTARYPRGVFAFVEGVMRWTQRVVAYAFLLVTEKYPPFSLAA